MRLHEVSTIEVVEVSDISLKLATHARAGNSSERNSTIYFNSISKTTDGSHSERTSPVSTLRFNFYVGRQIRHKRLRYGREILPI